MPSFSNEEVHNIVIAKAGIDNVGKKWIILMSYNL